MDGGTVAIKPTSRPLQLWLLTAGGFFSFFIFGFVDNLKGPTFPNLLGDLKFNYAQGGGILLGAYLGFVIATLLAGPLSDWVGNRTILLVAGLLIAAGTLGFSNATSYPLLFAAMLVTGMGIGAIEVGGNGLIVGLHPQAQGRYLNLLATFHGFGSLLVPLYAAWLLDQGISWRRVYQFSIPLTLILVLILLLTPALRTAKVASTGRFDWAVLRRTGFSPTMIGFYIAICLYVATEIGIASWIVEYLIQAKGIAQATAALYLSAFFAVIMLGRVAGSLLVDRIGYLRAILLGMIGALVCIAIAIVAPPALAFCLPLSGLFLSIIFPTMTATVSRLHPQNTGTILGLLFTAAGLGGSLGPWSIGIASNALGIGWGFALTLLFCVGVIGALAALMRREKNLYTDSRG